MVYAKSLELLMLQVIEITVLHVFGVGLVYRYFSNEF